MYRQVRKFVQQFRVLEEQGEKITTEEAMQREQLKRKLLSLTKEGSDHSTFRKVILVASMYSQAGASFLASNYAYLQSKNHIKTVLWEFPTVPPYLYFAIDGERREIRLDKDSARVLKVGELEIHTQIPEYSERNGGVLDLPSTFVKKCKGCSLLIVDVSSYWRNAYVSPMFDWADDIWFVIDQDLPRIARMVALEQPPEFWLNHQSKIRIISNRWIKRWSQGATVDRVEGTLSLWNPTTTRIKMDLTFPLLDSEAISKSQLRGKLLLEVCNEYERDFRHLINL